MNPCIVIPIYNHGDTIAQVVRDVEPLGLPCLIVDDGSDESTRKALDMLETSLEWVDVVRRATNGGKGVALQTGYREAWRRSYTHALQLDADGQHDATKLPELLAVSGQRPDALVLAVPTFDDSAPASRRYGRWIARFWTWLETCSFAIGDPLFGMRCMPLEAAVGVLDEVRCGSGMEFDGEIAVRLFWRGTPVVNVPTAVHYPEGGISHFRLVRDNIRISWLHTRLVAGALFRLPRLLGRARRATQWYQLSERGGTAGIRFTAWLYRVLGRRVAQWLVYPVATYFFLTDPSGRAASRAYLERVHRTPEGARALGRPPGWRDVWCHYLEFGISIFDRVGIWLGRREDFRLHVSGRHELDRVPAEKRGAVILGAHLGSFDAMRLVADAQSPIPVHVMMYTRHAERINSLFASLDALSPEKTGRVEVMKTGGFERVLGAKRVIERGEVLSILADRVHPGEERRVSRVSFLGSPAAFPRGPFLLAGLLGCPVLLMVGLRTGERSYEIHVERLADRVELSRRNREQKIDEYCQMFATRLEAHCLRAPFQWFNFYDFWSEEGPDEPH